MRTFGEPISRGHNLGRMSHYGLSERLDKMKPLATTTTENNGFEQYFCVSEAATGLIHFSEKRVGNSFSGKILYEQN